MVQQLSEVVSRNPPTRSESVPPGDAWQCLRTFSVVTLGRRAADGICGMETRNSGPHPAVPRASIPESRTALKMNRADVDKFCLNLGDLICYVGICLSVYGGGS